ncbi:MAG: pentapeptide repeat-containing protein [Sulfurimonas sp.]|nr:pentapeptide repeat-containing protein [Sulfurimonas sp.]
MKLRRWDNHEVIYELECDSIKALVESAVKNNVNLYRVDLRHVNLENANLENVNLTSTDLRYANLTGANLRYANLTHANLTHADLTNADLRYANLRYANLRYTNLTNSILRYTNLTNLNLTKVNLTNTDLTNAKGIDYFKCYHLYKYKSYILKQANKEPRVRMGCFERTIEEWEENFWNNDREFPNNNSKDSIDRLECYKTMINDYDEFKNS